MSDIFDSLFFPKKFFKKTQSNIFSSAFCFLFIAYLNLLAIRDLNQAVLHFFGIKGFFILFFIPFFLLFVFQGIDLLLIKEKKDNWIKTHYGQTYSPYLFLPLGVAFILRDRFLERLFGISFILSLLLWSVLLFSQISDSKKTIFIRISKDIFFLFLLLFFLQSKI